MSESGKHIKEVRKLRGLNQTELAEAAGVSISLVRKLEQGDREHTRLETLHKLAVALRVPTMRLSHGPRTEGPPAGAEEQWKAVRRMLERPPGTAVLGDEPPTVSGVSQALTDLTDNPYYGQDRFRELALLLPPLMRDAEALSSEGREIRARVMQFVGFLMVSTRQFEAADLALTRAMDDSSGRLEAAAAANTRCWLLLRLGKLDEALALAEKWADETEPRISRATPGELSMWGVLLLRMSGAAIRNNQPGKAMDALRFAKAAAIALGRERVIAADSVSTFGPIRVQLMRVENAGVLDRPDAVLTLARQVPRSALRPTSGSRNRHHLDVADALAKTGHYADAFERMAALSQKAPEWLPNQPYGRRVLKRIVEGRRTLTPEMRAMATAIHLEV
ncbi:helix-turn-helix domain-containing protein [Streptomyces sp. NPDC088258]|uniref:helix-turn-helix domain-containing protein n=1 Tax=Streptomyces sp. NPDC088258 TaxID=3365849 RepID=UPI0037FE1333